MPVVERLFMLEQVSVRETDRETDSQPALQGRQTHRQPFKEDRQTGSLQGRQRDRQPFKEDRETDSPSRKTDRQTAL